MRKTLQFEHFAFVASCVASIFYTTGCWKQQELPLSGDVDDDADSDSDTDSDTGTSCDDLPS